MSSSGGNDMDALNLDDLFLGGGGGGGGAAGDVGEVDVSDALFGDMDLDLGGNMDFFRMESGGSGRGGGGGEGALNEVDFGGSIEALGGRSSASSIEQSILGGPSAAASRGKKKHRTARSNPHLDAIEKQKEEQAAKTKLSALAMEAKLLQSEILPMEAKRKRRKSKKPYDDFSKPHDDDEEYVPEGGGGGGSGAIPATKKGKRSSSKKSKSSGLDSSERSSSSYGLSSLASQILQPSLSTEETEQARQRTLQKAQEAASKFGLRPSKRQFYPYMPQLPPEVDPKKRGKKDHPLLEKLNAHTLIGHGGSGGTHPPGSGRSISTDGALYQLFDRHLGTLSDGHGERHPEETLQSSLAATLKIVGPLASKEKKATSGKAREKMIQELGKLYLANMRQSAFLRQNLWNMERWCGAHLTKAELKSVGSTQRREVEWVVRMLQRERRGRQVAAEERRTGFFGGKRRLVNPDPLAPPDPQRQEGGHTHGGPDGAPVVSVRIKVKGSFGGWRDKSGTKLHARLWCPPSWTLALKRAGGVASGSGELVPVSAPSRLDWSSVDKKVMEAAASELVRPELLPRKKAPVPKAEATKAVTGPAGVEKGATGEKKKPSRKRKTKDAASTVGVVAPATGPKKPKNLIIPHVPSRTEPRFRPAVLAPSSAAAAGSGKPTAAEKDSADVHAQRHRLLQFLYRQVLHPSISPKERRQRLAHEITSTLQRLEGARASRQTPQMEEIQRQVEALQDAYAKDKEKHYMSNTDGMWKWMERNNYFGDVEKAQDVHDGLERCWPPEFHEECVAEEGHWGSLPPVHVVAEEEGDGESSEGQGPQQSSPLFDRLQSLLVEVDGESEDGEEDEDLISSLPPYSPEEFIHGPKSDKANEHSDEDGATLDVSALSLDQRTYIQLRTIGLASKNMPPLLQSRDRNLNGASNPLNEGESIDAILPKMKSRLSALHGQNNADTSALQRKALLHVAESRKKPKAHDPEAVLAKYKQLMKAQKEEKLKSIIPRTSGRPKTDSTKFDDEWLPW
ncbi:hypothetical protein ACHAXT_003296 [Thalassiosira profunda]